VIDFLFNRQSAAVAFDSPPAKKAPCDPFAQLRDGNPSNAETSETRSSGRQELASYKALTVPASHSTPLDFWRQNAKDFPALSEVARRVLCITASSAQSERDFWSVGRTITDARSRLSPDAVECMELIRWATRAELVAWE